jgi:transcriptional regulator GlxA family with amidase domain
MLEDIIIVGITMAVSELVKGVLKKSVAEDTVKQLIPLIVLGLAGALNVANAAVFAPDIPLVQALGQGIALGAVAGGVYSLGKAGLGKS